jgi:hypothetical protein
MTRFAFVNSRSVAMNRWIIGTINLAGSIGAACARRLSQDIGIGDKVTMDGGR